MKGRSQSNTQHVKRSSNRPPFSVYLSATFVVFFLTLSAADSVGFVPDYIDGTVPDTSAQSVPLSSLPQLGITSDSATSTLLSSGTEPVHISIPSVGIDLPVQNPTTTDVQTLDDLLKQGPAHFVQSADLGQTGTVIIFAHSSHLPVVINKMFQAFNQIPNVQTGATITLTGQNGDSYLYNVESVKRADVNDGTSIDMSPSLGSRLVLVTCDTLTGKSARFVLTASYVGVISNTSSGNSKING